jgi:RNA polymerase sigma factor (sigma-70 family)
VSASSSAEIAVSFLADERLRRKLFSYAWMRFGIQPEDTEDLLSDTTLEILKFKRTITSSEALIFTIFRRRCCAHMRRARAAHLARGVESEPRREMNLEDRLCLRDVFARQAKRDRRMLYAYFVRGQNLQEIARDLKVAPGSTWHLIERAMRRARKSYCTSAVIPRRGASGATTTRPAGFRL